MVPYRTVPSLISGYLPEIRDAFQISDKFQGKEFRADKGYQFPIVRTSGALKAHTVFIGKSLAHTTVDIGKKIPGNTVDIGKKIPQ